MTAPVDPDISVQDRHGRRSLVPYFAALTFALSAVMVLFTLRSHLVMGGHTWNTADWLINADVVHVRRGLFGSALLRVSDTIGISPLVTAITLQSTLVGLIAAMALRAIIVAQNRLLVALFVLSPGFCLLFWAADPSGAIRKEAVSYAAMSLLLLTNGQRRRDGVIVCFAALLFAFGVSGHIANAMLTPMFLFMAWIALDRPGGVWNLGAAAMVAWAAFNTWYPIHFSDIASASDVCQPLLDRGLRDDFCTDAIRVTAASAQQAVAYVSDTAYGHLEAKWHLIIYPALLIPVALLATRTNQARLLFWVGALSVVPLIPLYSVGYDWGRQTVMHITPLLLFICLMLLRGHMVQTRRVSLGVSGALVVLSVLWAPAHTFGVVYGPWIGASIESANALSP